MGNLLSKRMLLISAILLVVAALMVVLMVIPAAKIDSSSGAIPAKVVSAFGVNAALSALSAAGCFLIVFWSPKRNRSSTSILIALSLVVLVLGLSLADAASAYRSHDGSMQEVSTLLFVGAGLDLLAGAMGITVAIFRRKETKNK